MVFITRRLQVLRFFDYKTCMIFDHTDYRQYLKSALLEKQKKQPSYSMGVFARRLGLSQPAVSQVLAGKRNFSLQTARLIAEELKLKEKEAEYLFLLVQLAVARSPVVRDSLVKKVNDFRPRKRAFSDFSVDEFKLIADWQHLAICGVLELSDREFSVSSIAKRLGVKALEASEALDRLERLKLVAKDPDRRGHYIKSKEYVVASSTVPNSALRHFHRQMLEKAIRSLEEQSPEEKIVGSETIAISLDLLSEANEIVEDFFQKMVALSGKKTKKTDVYHLGVQFFKLTNSGERK